MLDTEEFDREIEAFLTPMTYLVINREADDWDGLSTAYELVKDCSQMDRMRTYYRWNSQADPANAYDGLSEANRRKLEEIASQDLFTRNQIAFRMEEKLAYGLVGLPPLSFNEDYDA